ncbi:MAG: hypothetical protein AB8H47_01980 [Bacteroidia bacterium]
MLFLIPFLLSNDLSAQINGYFGEIGGSYAQFTEIEVKKELAIRNSVGLLLGRNWAVGMKFDHIFYNTLTSGSEYMNTWGPFGRWGLRRGKVYFYGELGINWGNYSAVGTFLTGDVFKEKGLIYLSYGWAMDVKIIEGISIKLGMTVHEILNRPSYQYGLNTYVVGLVFDLQRRI